MSRHKISPLNLSESNLRTKIQKSSYGMKQEVTEQIYLDNPIELITQDNQHQQLNDISNYGQQRQYGRSTINMSKMEIIQINSNCNVSAKPVAVQNKFIDPLQIDNIQITTCQICLSQLGVSIKTLTKCEHANNFCESCLYNHVIYKIHQFQEVTCPQENCDDEIDITGQLFKSYPNTVRIGYNKIKRFYSTIKDSTLKLCPSIDCEGILKIEQNQPLKCGSCQNQFCITCLLAIHEGPCDEYEKNFLIQNLKYRQCAKCKMMIQKYIGCNQMTCLCKYQFCYICQSQWNQIHHGKHDSKGNLIIMNCCDICLLMLKIVIFFPLWILSFIIIYSPLIVLQIAVVIILSIFRGIVLEPCLMQPIFQLNKWIYVIIVVIFYPIFAVIGIISALGKMCKQESQTIFFLCFCDKGKINIINFLCSIFDWIFQRE